MVTNHQEKNDYELRKKRLDGYLAAISREDINPKSIYEHDYRVCSRHFMTAEPAKLYETNKPTLNLSHMKQNTRAPVDVERYERITERVRRRNAYEDLMEQAPVVVSQLVEEVYNN